MVILKNYSIVYRKEAMAIPKGNEEVFHFSTQEIK